MRRIVEDLLRVDGVVGSLLVGKDGLVVASTLLDAGDAEILGAMSAAVFGEIDKLIAEVDKSHATVAPSQFELKEGTVKFQRLFEVADFEGDVIDPHRPGFLLLLGHQSLRLNAP